MLLKKIIGFIVFASFALKPAAQVNLQTGTATFSLPMFNWNDDKSRLNAGVTLSYNSGNGLRVGDVASNIGQGWNLIAGGVITRLQVGEPDDQRAYSTPNASSPDLDTKKYPNGYLYANVPASNGCPVALTQYPIYKSKNQLYSQLNPIAEDKQLDYFSFQFNGKAGMFVLNGANNTGISLGDSKMKISFQHDLSMANNSINGIRTTITSFTIQDVDGLIYKFTAHGTTKLLRPYYCDQTFNYQQTQPNFENLGVYYMKDFDYNDIINPKVITSWFLTEIEDALTHRKIYFNYVNRPINSWAGDELNYNHDVDDKGHNKYYAITCRKFSVSETPEITSISYPDGHNVTFNYGADRVDLSGDKVLSSVDISYQGRYLSKYQLNTTYFLKKRYGTPVSDDQQKAARLCLKSVQKIGVDLKEDSPPYLFDYYVGSDNSPDDFVPPPFYWAKDIWGYYNGSNSVNFNGSPIPLSKSITELGNQDIQGLCFYTSTSNTYLNPKALLARNGLLRQIVYPTGGTLTYDYQQNSGKINGVSQNVGGVHVYKTSSTDGGYSNSCSNPVTTLYNFILENGASSLWGLEMPLNFINTSSHYAPADRGFHFRFSCGGFCCFYKYQYPGILSQQQAISLTDWQRFMSTTGATVLGILSTVMTIMDIATVIGGSTGVLAWAAVAIDIIGMIITIGVTCFHDYSQDNTATVFYNSDLHGISPLPAQFKRVEIVENPGTIGKTVQEFTSEDDYPVWEPSNIYLSSKQRFAPWAYGLPKSTTIFDAAGKKVKKDSNVYNFSTVFGAKCNTSDRYNRTLLLKKPLNKSSAKCLVQHTTSQKITDWNNNIINPVYHNYPTSDLGVEVYDLYTGRAELDTTYEKIFKSGDDSKYVLSTTSYAYNDDNYEVKYIRTVNSDGKQTQKNIFYTIDYVVTHGSCNDIRPETTTDSLIIRMVQNNIISLPVETNELVNVTSQAQYTHDRATLFTAVPNGDIKPFKVLEGRFAQPAWRNSPWPNEYSGFSFWTAAPLLDPASPDYSFYKTAQTLSYASTGELINNVDEGGRSVSSLYGYNNKYVVASAVNARPNEIYFADFEQNGWGGMSAYDNTKSHTGVYSGRIDNAGPGEKVVHADTWLNITLSAPTKYRYSGWIYSTGPSAEIFLFMKTATEQGYFTYVSSVLTTVVNKWVYVEGEYTVPANITRLNIRVDNNSAGTVWYDDIRLYPSNGRMTTYTYDPLIGKTSESDVNNRVTYYDYDKLGRLQFIKDENRNVVKMYEYNNVSTQNGCPGTYFNRQITEIFRKNDCGTGNNGGGYIGSDVSFVLPANTYSSTISQADADAKAENYILQNGQNYANANGTCIPVWTNTTQTQTFTTESCAIGQKGGSVTYIVAAGKYSSLISQADANQKALAEITANGQAFANDPANQVCTVDTDPDWEWLVGAPSRCQTVNGQLPPHLFTLATDVNPNSPSYHQTQWMDAGPSDVCPANYYYNESQSGTFNKNNCGGGFAGTAVTYTVAPGTYSSTTSLAAANQVAINDVNANGQNYANANGSCCSLAFNYAGGVSYTFSNINLSGSTVNFTLVFNYTAGYYSMTAGTLAGACTYPTGTRTIPYTNGSTVFNVIVGTNGVVQVQYVSGAYPSGTYGFTGSYDINVNSYYSAAASGTFTRNNCPAGQTGSSVTYSVSAYRYRSTISQADADQQAQTEVTNNGQSYANANGTCTTTVTITGSNSRTTGYVVTFSNGSFNQGFYIPAGANNATIGSVPAGTYNVTFQMAGGPPPAVNFSIGSYSAYSVTTYTFSGISITSTTLARVF